MTHEEQLDLMIELGWGSTPQPLIPKDWMQRAGPEVRHARWKRRHLHRPAKVRNPWPGGKDLVIASNARRRLSQ